MKARNEICIALMLCVTASALIVATSTASEDRSTILCKSEQISDILHCSQEKAKFLSDNVDTIKQKADSKRSKGAMPSFNAAEGTGEERAVKYYPTGLIVTAEELAENRVEIEEANRLMKASGINTTYPSSWDWRSKGIVTPVKDQSGCGACVAFAALAAEESAWLINNSSRNYDLSEWYLFQKGGGYCSSGSQFERILDAARYQGTVTEECCPYLKSILCTSPLYRISSWKKIYTSADAKEHISKRGPLMSGMSVYEDFYWVDSNKIYSQEWGSFYGHHAVCLVGYDDAAGCWIVKNSWSKSWGDGGFCRIAYDQCGIGSEFPFYAVEIAPASDPVPLPKTFSARVISRPAAVYDFGINLPDDKWVVKTDKYGATGEIGIYPSSQRFGYKLRTTEGLSYYSDQSLNVGGLKHASVMDLSGGRTWISWKGIKSKYSSDVLIEVTRK
ncbi:MAG: hypothetical protein LUQ44_01900 [Methanothrix sp.]|nr:hypothetical protein [Methanothrix sp.]